MAASGEDVSIAEQDIGACTDVGGANCRMLRQNGFPLRWSGDEVCRRDKRSLTKTRKSSTERSDTQLESW